ncbi:MAG: helix-turn-helix transcriptional regulator [Acidimicrobiales bacterium]
MGTGLRCELVGRVTELDAVRGALASARAGAGKLVFVHGEAGIGKTRLCQELRGAQDPRRTQLLAGRADPGDAATMFSALADALRAARRSEPDLWAALQQRRDALAAVVPEVVGRSPGPMIVERALLFEALLEVVEDAAGGRVTLWFLEDLHWADPSTWDFVTYAARRVGDMALALVVTFRDEELPHGLPVLSRFPTLWREPDTVDIGLDRLDQAETRALIQALDPLLPAGAVERVTERSAGTPLLVEELVATFGAHPEAIPDVIAMTVRERIRRVDPALRPVLEAVAVGGPQVDSGLLVRVLPDAPAEALDQLTAVGLLVAAGDAERPAIAFRHPLLWEAVYRGIPLAQRRTLHGRFAQAWDEAAPLEPERAARHHELADDPVASLQCLLRGRKAVHANVGRAASVALAALDLAGRHARLGEHRADLTRLAIEDLFVAGRWPELEPLVTAQWADRHRLTPPERAWLANVLVIDLFYLGAIARARTIAHEEIRRVEAAGHVEGAGLLFAQAGHVAWFSGDCPAAVRLARRALELADDPSQALVEVWARRVETLARHHLDRQRARAVAEHRAIAELAHAAGLPAQEASALSALAITSMRLDDQDAVERAGTEAGSGYASFSRVMQALLHTFEGRPDTAQPLLNRGGAGMRHGAPLFAPAVDAAAAHLCLHRGDLDGARQLLYAPSADAESASAPQWRAGLCGARGWLAWEDSQWEDAVSELTRSMEDTMASSYNGLETGPPMLPLHVDALIRLGRRDDARHVVDRCGRPYHEPDRFFLAALAAARFRTAPTDTAAGDAEHLARAAPWPWLDALVGCWRAELLGDTEQAIAARDTFHAIGATRGVERAQGVLRALGIRAPRDQRRDGQLSPRELEVAQLVAQGLSNSAIASRLFLSRSTVASHISHILTRLGASSRSQIATWVAQHAPN